MQQLRVVIDSLPGKIKELEMLAQRTESDYDFYLANKESIPNDERTAFGEEVLEALSDNLYHPAERLFDKYQGFDVYLPANMEPEKRYILIKRNNGGEYRCEMESEKTPLGCSKSIDYLLEHLNERADRFRQNAQTARKQKIEAQADLEKDNPYLKEIERISSELSEIDRQLEEAAEKEAV